MTLITKMAITDSFKKIVLKKPIGKITISDITDDCGISRMTFYYHFQDVYELVNWSFHYDLSEAVGEKKTYDTWQQGFLEVLNKFLSLKEYVLKIHQSDFRSHIENYFQCFAYDLLIDVIEAQAVEMDIDVLDADKQFIANFYKYSFVGMIIDWATFNMREDPQLLIDRLSVLIDGNIHKALNVYCIDNK